MNHQGRARVVLVCLAASLMWSPARAGQAPVLDRLVQSRQLYESAEYDRALAVMDSIDPQTITPALARDRALYQALCLFALDLRPQAEARLEAAVQADPLFRPGADLSPRVRTFVDDVRSRLRPALALQRYRAGKALFDAKNYEGALREFTVVRQLAEEAGDSSEASALSDLKTLSMDFADLSKRALAAGGSTRSIEARAPSLPFVPPVVIYQGLPAWPRDLVPPHGQLTGVLDIVVSARGDVGYVKLIKSIHPVYDVMLMSAARQWKYRPATRDGRPVADVKRLAIKVNLP